MEFAKWVSETRSAELDEIPVGESQIKASRRNKYLMSAACRKHAIVEDERNRADHPANTQRSSFSPATLLALNVTNLRSGIPIKPQTRVLAN